MSTLTENVEVKAERKPHRRLHVVVRLDAFLRLKHAAAKDAKSPGEVLSDLIEANLPRVEVAA